MFGDPEFFLSCVFALMFFIWLLWGSKQPVEDNRSDTSKEANTPRRSADPDVERLKALLPELSTISWNVFYLTNLCARYQPFSTGAVPREVVFEARDNSHAELGRLARIAEVRPWFVAALIRREMTRCWKQLDHLTGEKKRADPFGPHDLLYQISRWSEASYIDVPRLGSLSEEVEYLHRQLGPIDEHYRRGSVKLEQRIATRQSLPFNVT